MTVSSIRTRDTRRPRLTCTWVPVRGTDGRTRMEMRWVDTTSRRRARSAA